MFVTGVFRFMSCGTPSVYAGEDFTEVYINVPSGVTREQSCYCFFYTDTPWQNDQYIVIQSLVTGKIVTILTLQDTRAVPIEIPGMKIGYTFIDNQPRLTFRRLNEDVTIEFNEQISMRESKSK